MAKLYKVIVTEINTETNETREALNDTYTGFTLCAQCPEENRMAEVVMHDNIAGLAERLAALMLDTAKDKAAGLEDALFAAMMGKED